MRTQTIIKLCGALAVGALLAPVAMQAALVHPGMSHKKSDLDRMKYQVAAQIEPYYSSYQTMCADAKASYNYTVRGNTSMTTVYRDAPYTNKGAFESDSKAAYFNAIRWIVEGDSRYAAKAVECFNAWTGLTLVQPGGTETLSGSMIYIMLEAAEIIKNTYTGWSTTDINKFKAMLVYPGYSSTTVPSNLSTQGTWYWRVYMGDPNRAGNQELAGWRACMAIGIFLDNEVIYDRAYRYVAGLTHRSDDLPYASGPNVTNGVITTTPYNIAYNYLSTTTVADAGFDGVFTNYIYENGQCAESSRDQGHTLWGLSLVASISEMAWNQGDNLWGLANNRVLLGMEFSLRYNLSYLQSYSDQTSPWEPTVANGLYLSRLNKTARTQSLAINPYEEYSYTSADISRGGGLANKFYELLVGHYVGRGFESSTGDAKWSTRARDYAISKWGYETSDSGGAYLGYGGLTFRRPYQCYGDPISGFNASGLPVYAMNVLPKTIEAENFDYSPVDGTGRTYNDTSSGNSGSAYRPYDDVDIQATSDSTGGYNVGWIDTGEWLTYTVYVPTTSTYNIAIRYSAPNSNGSIRVYFAGTDETGVVTVPSTGGWNTWKDLTLKTGATLNKGVQSMRIVVSGAKHSFNLNQIKITAN